MIACDVLCCVELWYVVLSVVFSTMSSRPIEVRMALRIPPKHSSASTPSGGSPHAFRQLLDSKASGNGSDNFWAHEHFQQPLAGFEKKKNQAIFYFRNHRKKDEIQFKEFLRYYPSKIDLRASVVPS